MADPQAIEQVAVEEIAELDDKSLLDQIVETGIKPRDDTARDRATELVKNLVEQLVDPSMVVQKGVTETINARIAAIDAVMSRQTDAIMHSEEFQKLEASWRGLRKLVFNTETGESMKIRVLNCSKKDLLRDFQSASEFTESALWKNIYEFEYGTYGGDPYGALIGDCTTTWR